MEMKNKRKIGVLIGSLRKESYSRKVAESLRALAPENMELEFIAIDALEMFNQDFDDEGTVPESWVRFRDLVKQMDAFLFVTPEYNRSIPAVMKNALDVGSRPYGYNAWDGKPGAVVGVSPGTIGAFGANHILRQSLVFLNVPAMQQPEAYVANAATLHDEHGELILESTREFFRSFLNSFSTWIDTILNN
jgi:chromate reductase